MPHNIIKHESEHLYSAPPRTAAGRALSAALLRLRRADRARELHALALSGLSNLDLRALRYIVQAARDERSLGPKDLVTMLGTSSANVTNVIDRLARKGLVERLNHPTDRRARYLHPTDAAVQTLESAMGDHHSAIIAEIDRLDDADAAAAAAALERIAVALEGPAEPD